MLNLLKKLKKQKLPKLQKNQQKQNPLSSSGLLNISQKVKKPQVEIRATKTPNLLSTIPISKIEPLLEKHHLAISSLAKISIISTQAIFILILGLNTRELREITQLENSIQVMETSLIEKKVAIDLIEDTIIRIKKLTTLEEQRPDLGEKLQLALDITPPSVNITRLSLKENSLELKIETATPLEASLLMTLFINKDFAKEIRLKSSVLSVSKEIFITVVEVIWI